jgi:DNA-binding beta-propeller fold protein YncE
VSVIDIASNTVIDCVNVPDTYESSCGVYYPYGIAITSDGKTAYVCNQGGGSSGDGSVSIIDVASNTVTGCVENDYSLALCGFYYPTVMAITPDGRAAYVCNSAGGVLGSGSVSIIELTPPTPPVPPTPTILSPATVSGRKTHNRFLLQTDFINKITWTAPSSGTVPVAYNIYRDSALTQLVATVPASGPLQYYDHNRQPNVVYTYYIVSVDVHGNVSTANSVTVTNGC